MKWLFHLLIVLALALGAWAQEETGSCEILPLKHIDAREFAAIPRTWGQAPDAWTVENEIRDRLQPAELYLVRWRTRPARRPKSPRPCSFMRCVNLYDLASSLDMTSHGQRVFAAHGQQSRGVGGDHLLAGEQRLSDQALRPACVGLVDAGKRSGASPLDHAG